MKETIELRLKPELKIVFNTEGFELTDASAPKNSGFYLYKNIKNIKLNKEGRSWFVTVVSNLLDFFIFGGGTVTGREKDKANLQVMMASQNFKVWLIDADIHKAEKVADMLNKKSLK